MLHIVQILTDQLVILLPHGLTGVIQAVGSKPQSGCCSFYLLRNNLRSRKGSLKVHNDPRQRINPFNRSQPFKRGGYKDLRDLLTLLPCPGDIAFENITI
ncbi:hypothetical protein D3C75_920440 [compost metagenome]